MASEATATDATMNAQGEVAETKEKTEEMPAVAQVNPSEEKNHAAHGEDDGGPIPAAALAVEQETIPNSPPPPARSPESSSPPEASKQTLDGEAALHSSAAVKVATSKSAEDGPVSPENNHATYNDDDDSSNDDSSYFADPSNLPSPGEAGRKYSFGSQASANRNNAGARESDASLSLSEDSEDEHGKTIAYSPANPEVFPQQRITRMHSVGSLVSTSSQNDSDNDVNQMGGYQADKPGPHTIYTPHAGAHSVPHGSIPPVVPDYRQYQPQGYPYQQHQPLTMNQQQQDQWMASLSNPQPGGPGMWSNNNGGPIQYQDLNGQQPPPQNGADKKPPGRRAARETKKQTIGSGYVDRTPSQVQAPPVEMPPDDDDNFKVYWQRWLMLMYMSLLNLLSDWTCYSVAPIALLTQEAFGDVDPEQLVTIFLAANAVASALEPIILSRLGLRRTVLFGALLLMTGSMVKSGGMPPIIEANLEKGHCEWQLYLGFFLVGLSQPLYQCTPALLSASWFPEQERTMATGVALNSNQLGIGCAFVFGTLLVENSNDIPGYFGLLSIISTLAFFGTLFQFDDAPPTPPSDSARVMRGTLEVNLPSVKTILESIGVSGHDKVKRDVEKALNDGKTPKSGAKRSSGKTRRSSANKPVATKKNRGAPPSTEKGRQKLRGSSGRHRSQDGPYAPAPSAALYGTVSDIVASPSPMMPGSVGPPNPGGEDEGDDERRNEQPQPPPGYNPYNSYPGMMPMMPPMGYPGPYGPAPPGMSGYNPYQSQGYLPQGQSQGYPPQGQSQGYPPQGYPPQGYGAPQGYPGYGYAPNPQYPPQYSYPPQGYQQAPPARGMPPHSYQHQFPRADLQMYTDPYSVLPPVDGIDAGAEPVLTITPHHLDIDIRDDQIILAIRACFARPGFIHSLVAFTVSGIVINTLSTYMDYLVRLNGAGREYTGIIGGSFQVIIMVSSLIIGSLTDKSRAYYSVTIGMLVVGAFGLAECGVSLNADRGSDLRVALIVVAALVGPLQPVSTELGVEVVYPLSENTVLVIQQLFSNLLSALFIPLFKLLKDVGISEEEGVSQPQYTFSFYLLIVLHAAATVFVATFNGRYLRYEHELQKKDEKDRKRQEAFETASLASMASYQASLASGVEEYEGMDSEHQQLVPRHQLV